MSDTVRVFKALSDGTRLRILNILLVRECCVCEVMQVLGISQPSASRHLSILRGARLLKARKEGIWMYYSVDHDGVPAYAQEIVKAVRLAAADMPEARLDKQKLQKTMRQNTVCIS
ncbi:MAG: metalloregulator ArsR/SmtB family transcription factor [Chloroflexi bacterium]|nr:metalloregulator ArsR/SmtB family transcription factor [Chloroflexota bacterium]